MSFLTEKKVLVTGASGFIGEHLCRSLAKQNAVVFGVSRNIRDGAIAGVKSLRADLSDERQIKELIEKVQPDYVYHLASYVSGAREVDAVKPTLMHNLLSVLHLLTAIQNTRCKRIILAGSLEETDADAAVPCSPYAAAKSAATMYASMFHALYQTPIVTARLFMVYGPAQKDEKKLIPYTIKKFLKGEPAQFSSGEREVDWIYVDDVVEALILMAEKPGLEGEILDIGSGELFTIREIVETLHKITQSKSRLEFGAIADRPQERIRRAEVEKTAGVLGWRPRLSIADGLQKTIQLHR